METVTNAATGVVNAASNVASVASQAIWGDATKKDAAVNETTGKEPVSGEVGDVKSGEPYDKGNEDSVKPTTSEPKSLTKTTSKEVPSAHSTADLTKPGEPEVPTTETLASTQIEPLKDAKKDPEEISAGGASLAQQVKTGSGGTNSTGTEEGVKNLTLKEFEQKNTGVSTNDEASKPIAATDIDPLKKENNSVPAATSSSPTTPSKVTSSSSDLKDEKEHKSLKEKIKEKLHHKKHDK